MKNREKLENSSKQIRHNNRTKRERERERAERGKDQIREDSDQEIMPKPIVESPMDPRKKAGAFVNYLVRSL